MKFREIILLAALAIVLFFWWQSCRKTVTPVQITVRELIHDTVVNNAVQRHIADSFNRVIQYKDAENSLMYKDFTILLNENQVLQNENILLGQPVPDTCKALDKAWQDKYSAFAKQTGQTTLAANRTIDGLKSTVATQHGFMKAKDTALSVTKRSLAECIASYKAVPKAKNEINIGVSVLSGWDMTTAPGVALGYRSKKGWQFDGAVYTNKASTFTIRKNIISWK